MQRLSFAAFLMSHACPRIKAYHFGVDQSPPGQTPSYHSHVSNLGILLSSKSHRIGIPEHAAFPTIAQKHIPNMSDANYILCKNRRANNIHCNLNEKCLALRLNNKQNEIGADLDHQLLETVLDCLAESTEHVFKLPFAFPKCTGQPCWRTRWASHAQPEVGATQF